MLKLRLKVKDEDKFSILMNQLRFVFETQTSSKTLESLDIDSKDYVFYLLEYNHPRYLNYILNKIKHLAEVLEIEIHYAFVYRKTEAYTDIDTISGEYIHYNSLSYGHI